MVASSITAVGLLCFVWAAQAAVLPNNNTFAPEIYHRVPLSEGDYLTLYSKADEHRSATILPGFHYLYVKNDGTIVSSYGTPGQTIEVAASPNTQSNALHAAANDIAKMVRLMPNDIFQRISIRSSVGVFTKEEKLIIFPEFMQYANGNCGTSCTGSCAHTCTFDGRKWETLLGIGGIRAAVVDQNVICGPQDPHRHNLNVMIHEFGHIVHRIGMSSAQKAAAKEAYNNAKTYQLWDLTSYAMATEEEYMATAASVFFGACNDAQTNTGGMNLCGSYLCPTEEHARYHLYQQDPKLYYLMVEVYTNNRGNQMSGLSVCPS